MDQINSRWRRRAITLALTVLASPLALAQSATPTAPAVAPPSAATTGPDEASSYSLGLVFGNQLHSAGLGAGVSFDAVMRGLKDGMDGKLMSPEDKDRAMQMVRAGRDNVASRNHAAAQEVLAKNKSVAGVTTTASGLQYEVVAPGEAGGAHPTEQDRVTVHYRGQLLDGTVFDSSDAHAQAATFSVNSVIKGWREALLLMKPGAKWRLYIPPELAYDMNSPPTIPPGSMLVFDVELVKIEPQQLMHAPPAKAAPKNAKPAAGQQAPKSPPGS
jgi:FKBP-type peptidyl-prolyl cis-trans isomerase FklB